MNECFTNGRHTPGCEWEIECPVLKDAHGLRPSGHTLAGHTLARVDIPLPIRPRVVAQAYPLSRLSWQSEAKYREYISRWDAERAGSHYLMGGVGAAASPDAQEAPSVTKPGDQGGGTGSPFSCIVTTRKDAAPRGGFRNGRAPRATPNGRPPQHRSAADRQRAYRARAKASMLAGNDQTFARTFDALAVA